VNRDLPDPEFAREERWRHQANWALVAYSLIFSALFALSVYGVSFLLAD
jgi:hypothetical protein